MTYLNDKAVYYIVQHYSATPIEKDYSSSDIDRMHRGRGFKKIGYHYYIRKNGAIEKGRDMSEPGRFEQGAHSKGENASSIGICIEGGVTLDEPTKGVDNRTEAQKTSQIKLIKELLIRFPGATVIGHRDMPGAATQCPGYDAGAWWASVNKPVPAKPTSHSSALNAFLTSLVSIFMKKEA